MADEHEAIIRRYFERATQGDVAAIDEVLDEKVVLRFPGSSSPIHGRDGYRKLIETYRTATPGMKVRILDMAEHGDSITVRWTAEFQHTGTFRHHSPTGKHGTISGRDVIRIANGKIVEITDHIDFEELEAQLGFKPTLD